MCINTECKNRTEVLQTTTKYRETLFFIILIKICITFLRVILGAWTLTATAREFATMSEIVIA